MSFAFVADARAAYGDVITSSLRIREGPEALHACRKTGRVRVVHDEDAACIVYEAGRRRLRSGIPREASFVRASTVAGKGGSGEGLGKGKTGA